MPSLTAKPKICIGTAHAELHGIDPGAVLPHCLKFRDPKAHYNEAMRRGDWDGKVEMFSGRQFPAGLSWKVAEYLQDLGYEVVIEEQVPADPVDFSHFTDEYLVDPTNPDFRLRPHQMRAIQACLGSTRGVVDSPTGSGKTEMIAANARLWWEECQFRTLLIEPRKGVARQTYKRFVKYYGDDLTVGYFAEGERIEGPVVVATAQTMLGWKLRHAKGKIIPADPQLRALVKDSEVLMFDECHRTSSNSWYDIGIASNATHRYGFSGTPLKGNALDDARLLAVTGPVLCSIKPSEMVDSGFAALPKIAMVASHNASGPALDPKLSYADAYQQGIVENVSHNTAVIKSIEWLVEHGRQTLVLCRRKEHFTTLSSMLEDCGIPHIAVWGASDNADRDQAKRSFEARTISVILATTIWDEGEDVANVEAIVLAEGVKVSTNARQRIGRGMRPDTEDVWVVDFAPLCFKKLGQHAQERAKAYEKAGFEVMVLDDWPAITEFADRDAELLPFLTWTEDFE